MEIIAKFGGYRKLDAFTLATIVQLGTLRFCGRFLNLKNDPKGRQYDQMTQAARSGRANLIEGSERAGTSKETEMKLTDVARASLGELMGDYEIFLLDHGQAPWPKDSPEAQAVFMRRLDPVPEWQDVMRESGLYALEQMKKFDGWLNAEDGCVAANALLLLCRRVIVMLNRQIQRQGEQFAEQGGFTERMSAVRLAARDAQDAADGAPACPKCGKPMRKRMARKGRSAGKPFWSCTAYPACDGTRDFEEASS